MAAQEAQSINAPAVERRDVRRDCEPGGCPTLRWSATALPNHPQLAFVVELREAALGGLSRCTVRIRSEDFLVELFRVGPVHLPLFELGRLQQLLRLVAATGRGEKTQHR